ncbi:MAG: aminotransferase class V-fold PLP-dependent enzyme [Candidatus Thermoplasmatota archaeon]|nr:aminotransferase class V-fold PLP-dependent enzyme [Candidatus Thermoplasmatota archaeon]MEC9001677.1 aminotransferase class V-fold PLP-dependent enzyme [Candidatus Thermoplasmatota archaeon]
MAGDSLPDWINLSYANVATTSPAAHKASLDWSDALARGGAAEFDGEAEKNGMMPLRRAAARLLSCSVEDVCVGSSATELLCSLAWAVSPPRGSNIVSTKASFPSTVYPWTRVADENGAEVRLADHDSDLYTNPEDILSLIDEKTSVVTLSHVEFSSGQRYDLRRFSDAAHSVGAMFVVDATQSMGMVPIDAASTGADVIVSSGYKWLRGTYGAAIGYISPSVCSNLYPGLLGFRSHDEIWNLRAERMTLPKDASRFEYTTIHFGAALGLAIAVDEICNIGIQEVWEHDLALADNVIEGANQLGISVVSPSSEGERSAIVSLRMPEGVSSETIARRLQDEHSILVTSRAGLLRVSPHIDNSGDEVGLLFDALEKLLS